jgi:cytochrome P450
MRSEIESIAPIKAFSTLPKADGLPFLGSIQGAMGDLRAFLTAQYLKHGSVFKVQVLHQSFTVLAGVEANKWTNREGKNLLSVRETWQAHAGCFGAENSLLTLDGVDHTRMRKVQRKGYSRAAIEARVAEIITQTRADIRNWPLNQHIDGLNAIQKIIAGQIGLVATDMYPEEYFDDLIYFVRIVVMVTLTKRLPTLAFLTPRFKKSRKRVQQLYQKVVDHHLPKNQEKEHTNLIDDLLKLSNEDPQFLPESDLMVNVLGPFVAGLDTSAASTAFALYAVLSQPDLLAEAKTEAERILSLPEVTAEDLKSFDCLNRIVLETLRMYPTAPAIQRTAKASFVFAGYRIPKGEKIVIATTVPHYLPEYYPEPEKFDIYRHTPEKRKQRPAGAFAPFGAGTHTCLGAGFAELQMMMTLAIILYDTDIALSPPDYQLKIDSLPGPSPDKHFGFKIKKFGHTGGE